MFTDCVRTWACLCEGRMFFLGGEIVSTRACKYERGGKRLVNMRRKYGFVSMSAGWTHGIVRMRAGWNRVLVRVEKCKGCCTEKKYIYIQLVWTRAVCMFTRVRSRVYLCTSTNLSHAHENKQRCISGVHSSACVGVCLPPCTHTKASNSGTGQSPQPRQTSIPLPPQQVVSSRLQRIYSSHYSRENTEFSGLWRDISDDVTTQNFFLLWI